LIFTDRFGNTSLKDIQGRTCEISERSSDVIPEEYTEPPKEIDITRPQDYKWSGTSDLVIVGIFRDTNNQLLVISEDADGFFDTDGADPIMGDLTLKEDL